MGGRVQTVGLRVQRFGVRVLGFGFRILGLGGPAYGLAFASGSREILPAVCVSMSAV